MATGVLSKGIKLSYKTSGSGTYNDLSDLQSIPALGGKKDSVEITTLADAAHTYMAGLENYGDSLDFVFLLRPEADQFETLSALTGSVYWQVTLPTGDSTASPVVADMKATFTGTFSIGIDAANANAAMTYTLSIKPDSAIIFA